MTTRPGRPDCSRLAFRRKPSPTGRSPWPSCLITSVFNRRHERRSRRCPGTAMRPFSPGWLSTTRPPRGPTWPSNIHNRAVARLIRLAQTRRVRDGRTQSWREVLEAQGVVVHSTTRYLAPERIGDLRVATDFQVEGMDHVYRSSGLGVPLIAHRFTDESGSPDVQDQFFPREMRIAATAVVRPGGGSRDGRLAANPVHDRPARSVPGALGRARRAGRSISPPTGRRRWRCRWLAVNSPPWNGPGYLIPASSGQVSRRASTCSGRTSLARSPWSSSTGLPPARRAWVQTINELQNTPSIAARYQFWMFMYPTGQPIPGSAARLRQSLIKVRETLRSQPYRPRPRSDGTGRPQHGRPSRQDDGARFEAHTLGCHDHRPARPVQGVP